MEIFCKKEGKTASGQKSIMEYKLITSTVELGTLGNMKSYGVSIKRFSEGNFEYKCYEDLSSKPNTVIKLIKQMFDEGTTPLQAEEFLRNFSTGTCKVVDNGGLLC